MVLSRTVSWLTGASLLGGLLLFSSPTADQAWLEFDSADHAIICPADHCVSGYRVEMWQQGAVGVGTPVLSVSRERWEVEATGRSPAYRLPLVYPPWKDITPNVHYVWTLRALGEFKRNPSPRSNPTQETLVIQPLAPATGVEVH